jgi:hypothetical protein
MKIVLTAIVTILIIQSANAQNTPWSTTGNIGIGTISPTTPLTVNGIILANISNASGDNSNIQFGNANAATSSGDKRGAIWLDNDGRLKFRSVTGYGIAFRNVSNTYDIMNVTDNGLSIGTANVPTGYLFSVNGSAIATSMTVKLNANWPDYVFKPSYHLASLNEINDYISQNHHLPEIPSAQEIAKDGLNIGEMNKILVKKVEELTLYLIEKDHKQQEDEDAIKTQQEEINQLKQQVQLLIKTANKN